MISVGPLEVSWLAGPMVRIESETGVVVYTDPVRYADKPHDGDLVVVTAPDAYDQRAIERVVHEEAIVLCSDDISTAGAPFPVEPVGANESFVLGPLDIATTPVPGRVDACGYAITLDGVRVHWPGQLAASPDGSVRCDCLLVPLGSLGLEAAIEFVSLVEPDIAVPVKYDDGSVDEASFVQQIAKRGVAVALGETR